MTDRQDKTLDGVNGLLDLLEKKIREGTITAAEQANYIKLITTAGLEWLHSTNAPAEAPIVLSMPFDGDEDGDPRVISMPR